MKMLIKFKSFLEINFHFYNFHFLCLFHPSPPQPTSPFLSSSSFIAVENSKIFKFHIGSMHLIVWNEISLVLPFTIYIYTNNDNIDYGKNISNSKISDLKINFEGKNNWSIV